MSKVALWYLYDFANSFASSVVIFYFPLLLAQGGASDAWIGISASLSTAILLFFYPALGHQADMSHRKTMWYLWLSSIFMVVALFVMGIMTHIFSGQYPLFVLLFLSVAYMIFQISFQGSYIFYSAFMQHFENAGENKDRVSGFGMGLGQLGNAVSIGLMGAFVVGGSMAIFGVSGKSLALIFGAVIFMVLGIPFLTQTIDDAGWKLGMRSESFSLKEFLRRVFENKQIFYYLLGYMLIADSVSSLQIYLTLYLRSVFGFTDKMSSMGGAMSLFILFVTCMVLGGFAVRIKNKKKLLLTGGSVYVLAFLLFGLAPGTPSYAYMSLAFAGMAYGWFFPLARSLYSDLVPKESQAEYFSSFVIFERAATIIGPIMWVAVFALMRSAGALTLRLPWFE
jgi:UMF1 family MFS transporter